MAKHVILEAYTFVPGTKTITVIGKNIRREQLLLITNVTSGVVIYNFSDPSLSATSYTNATDSVTGQETTTLVLSYNTAAMGVNDKLSILVEETFAEMLPAESLRDPVDKLRVSTPQSLIDTDFEYGMQPTKWETLSLLNNRPSAFYDPTAGISNTVTPGAFVGASGNYQITNATASGRLVTVAISNTTGITVGTPIFITGTVDAANADGWWVVESVSANTNITFSVTTAPAASLFDATKTYLYIGAWFTGAAIPAATNAIVLNGSVATVTTTGAHGLRPGDGIYIIGVSGQTGTLLSSWVVATTPTNNTFTFACTATGTITATLNASIYPRGLGYTEHRPYDGGVQFSNETPYHGYQVVRQTRRQFRYQSGKAMQFSTGSILKPALYVDNVTSSGTTVTVTTRYPHGLLPGAIVRVTGAVETAYNGNFAVVTAANPVTFTYTALSTPSATPATGFPINISPFTWYGGSNRVGMFDSQNGFYFEFDGQTLYAVKRSSTAQLSGRVTATLGSQSVVGTGTKFSSQLKPGDFIVIRGMSYIVQIITSDTQLYIYPEYRGVTISNAIVSKTVNTRYPQSTWNIDKLDGTGSSLMNLDLTKMQMFYIDYTWYGAGAIRFGFKNNRGEVIYCHRIPNNNVNYEAYMRSGNLVARYETNTIPYQTYVTATWGIGTGVGTISVADTTGWPPSGVVAVYAAAATGAAIEYMAYSSKTLTSLVISARAQTGGTSATAFTHSATAPLMVELYSPQAASTISHWGSSVIMDGRFDDDKSLVFVAGMNSAVANIGAGVTQPLISIRVSPSVDNGLTGILGNREIINRMQMVLRSMGVYSTGTNMTFLISLRLNGRISGGTFAGVGGSSLAQVAFHTAGQTIVGGEQVAGFFTTTPGVSSYDLSTVRDIGNCILGGGNSLAVPNTANNVYPDGPDILTLCATNVTAVTTNSINARISWTEAQA
jgi:hypothetical protein